MLKFKQYFSEMIHGKTDRSPIWVGGDMSTHQSFNNTASQYAKNMPDEHKKSLFKYTKDSSALNSSLRSGKVTHPAHKKQIEHIDKSFIESPHDIEVRHGVRNGEHIKHLNSLMHSPDTNSHTLKSPAYISTTTNSAIAEKFSDDAVHKDPDGVTHILRIHVKKGHKIAPLGHLSEYSGGGHGASNEHEVLLHRESSIKIHNTPEIREFKGINGKEKYKKKIAYWHAELEQ